MNFSAACSTEYLTSPNFLLTWEHSLTVVSTPVHIFGFYCILKETPSSMSTVKWSLLNLHVWTIILDYSFSLLVIPFIFWPTMGGVPLGLLQYAGVSTAAQFYGFIALMGLVSVSILSMFEGRFNILFVKPNDFWSRVRTFWLWIHYAASFLFMAPPFLDTPNQEELKVQSFRDSPCLPNSISHEHLFILSLDIVYSSIAVAVFTMDIVLEVLFFFSFIYFRTLRQLNANSMSSRTFRLQRILIVSLFIQVLIPLNLFIFPVAYVSYATIFEVRNQARNNLSVATASLHGICSTLTMLLIHRPYRNLIWRMIRGGSNPMKSEVNSAKISVVVQMS